MKNCSKCAAAALLVVMVLAHASSAGPVTREEGQRQARMLEQLKKSLEAATTDAAKFVHFARVMKGERDVGLRRRILDIALEIPGPELETFLGDVLVRDSDAGIRSLAATKLGLIGSEKSLAVLATAAASDPTTSIQIGDIGSQSSARRAATFAIGELALRLPKLADEAAEKLLALPAADDPKDNEGLADARAQALYQITRDDDSLKPFYERLKSKDAKERRDGVNAFQFLRLKRAPAEIVEALQDTDIEVRRVAALVLGDIGDAKTAAALMAIAGNPKDDRSVRCNAIHALGRMKAAAAADLMEKLVADPASNVRPSAAVALYRITGKKVEEFPEGYNAD